MPGKAPSGSAESNSSIAIERDSGSAADTPTRPSRGLTTATRDHLAELVERLLPAFLHAADVRRGLRRRADDLHVHRNGRFLVLRCERDGLQRLHDFLSGAIDDKRGHHQALVRNDLAKDRLAGIHGSVGTVHLDARQTAGSYIVLGNSG